MCNTRRCNTEQLCVTQRGGIPPYGGGGKGGGGTLLSYRFRFGLSTISHLCAQTRALARRRARCCLPAQLQFFELRACGVWCMLLAMATVDARTRPGVREMRSALRADVSAMFTTFNGVLEKEGKQHGDSETRQEACQEVGAEDEETAQG